VLDAKEKLLKFFLINPIWSLTIRIPFINIPTVLQRRCLQQGHSNTENLRFININIGIVSLLKRIKLLRRQEHIAGGRLLNNIVAGRLIG